MISAQNDKMTNYDNIHLLFTGYTVFSGKMFQEYIYK